MSRIQHRLLLTGACLLALAAGITARAQADSYADIQAQIDQGKLRQALEAAEALTAANPADCRAWQLAGDAQRKLTKVDLAVADYEKGLKACPDDKGLLTALGFLYSDAERYEDAVRVLGRLWSLDASDPLIGSRLGAACYRAGNCDEGRKVYAALLAAHPDRRNDRLAYAQLLARLCRDHAAAQAEYEKLLADSPGDAAVGCALAYMLADAGRTDEAVKAAQEGLKAAQGNQGCLYAAWGRALEAGADSLMIKGNVGQARELYRLALEPLNKGIGDPIFGDYCKAIVAEVRYKEAPMEELATR